MLWSAETGPVRAVHHPRGKTFLSARFNCGDFCGDATVISGQFEMPSVNLVQVLNSAQKNGLQGFLSSVQQFSEMLRRGLLNRYTG